MSAHREEHLDLCAAMLLGTLDGAERAELESHLASGCPVCVAELARLSEGVELLAHVAPKRRAPAAIRTRVLELVSAEPKRAGARPAARRDAREPFVMRRRPRLEFVTVAWGVAALLLAVAGLFAWRASTRLSNQLDAARAEVSQLRQQLLDEHRWSALLDAPGSKTIALQPTPDSKTGIVARVTFDAASGRALVVCENAVPPAGHDFELWAITPQGPASLGLVKADASGRAIVRLDHVANADSLGAFAISLESEGGSPTSTAPGGPVVMVGKLAG